MHIVKRPFIQGVFLPILRGSLNAVAFSGILSRGFHSQTKDGSAQNQNSNIYTEKYRLSQEEMDQILMKPAKSPNILHEEKVEIPELEKDYEETIEAKLGKVRSKVVKVYTDTLEKAAELRDSIPTIRPSDRPDVKYYKYDLPIPNLDPEIKGVDELLRAEEENETTPTINLFSVLRLNGKSDYQTFEVEFDKKYNNEVDMYGDEVDLEATRDEQITKLGDDAIPNKQITDKKYMDEVRRCFTLNINMPGTIENEDPNRFIRGLRPIEEFRNTPLIPISDSYMRQHQKKLEEFHRGGLYFEVKTDTLLSAGLFLLTAFVGWQLVTFLMEKDEEIGAGYERMRLQRLDIETPGNKA